MNMNLFFSEYGRYLEDALNSVEPKVFGKVFLVTFHLYPWDTYTYSTNLNLNIFSLAAIPDKRVRT